MKEELDNLLCEKYPKIFRDRHGDMQATCMCWGFECGDGWYDLIERLCAILQWDTDHNRQPQIIASQVKEKFGGLRFYTEGSTERQDGCIDFAELMSLRICDVCGSPGKCNEEGWISCRCKEHRR